MSTPRGCTGRLHPGVAALAAFGFSLPIWYAVTDHRWVIWMGIVLGFIACEMGARTRGSGWYAHWRPALTMAGIVALGFALLALVFDALFPETFNRSLAGGLLQQSLLFTYFFIAFSYLSPVTGKQRKTVGETAYKTAWETPGKETAHE